LLEKYKRAMDNVAGEETMYYWSNMPRIKWIRRN